VEPKTPTLSLPQPSSGLPVLEEMMDSLFGLTGALLVCTDCRNKPNVAGGFTESFDLGSLSGGTFNGCLETGANSSEK